ncbi:hypothetical protein EFQ99_28965 [Rhizobium vallis]|uniref:SyrB-like regulator n=1 Tax=Rhizobium vallis TaxID=634290 RepID=A0A432PCN2_9HYPH|nr:hypothetical protein [Rhizobium vallis]RUM20661.1 hypothetical protein EFQ99_28965 [Rhizobium vallis]
MAEENNTAPAVAAGVAAVETPAVKKTRAPRQKKAVAAPADVPSKAAAAPAESVKAASGRGRRAKAVVAKSEVAAKATRAKRTPKAAVQPQTPAVAVLDEIEDLIKLEEENQRLRKLLAEKLRNENADLRRRLDRV